VYLSLRTRKALAILPIALWRGLARPASSRMVALKPAAFCLARWERQTRGHPPGFRLAFHLSISSYLCYAP